MGPWRYKVDVSSAIRTLEDLEPGQIDVKLARRNLAAAFRRAKANLPPHLAESFEGLAQAVERKKTVKGIDEVLAYLYDLADEERIWLMEPPGPRDWLPKAPPPSMGAFEDTFRKSSFELIWSERGGDPEDDPGEILTGPFVLLDSQSRRFVEVKELDDPYEGIVVGFVDLGTLVDLEEGLENLRDALEHSSDPFPDFENALESWRQWELDGFPPMKTLDEKTLRGIKVAAQGIFKEPSDLDELKDPLIFLDARQAHRLNDFKEDYGFEDVRLVKSPEKALKELLFEMGLGPLLGPREWRPKRKPKLGGLEDLPLPENTPRPEMWTAESVVQAVKDGFTFLVSFIHKEPYGEPNAYWIGGDQYMASAFTVGPEHTPEIRLLDDGWIQAKTYFRPEMVPERTWLTPPNENGVIPVHVEIDPETIDWDNLNRGHQIRVPRGML